MNPVVGVDEAKGESEIQAFLDKGKPYSLMERIFQSSIIVKNKMG